MRKVFSNGIHFMNSQLNIVKMTIMQKKHLFDFYKLLSHCQIINDSTKVKFETHPVIDQIATTSKRRLIHVESSLKPTKQMGQSKEYSMNLCCNLNYFIIPNTSKKYIG